VLKKSGAEAMQAAVKFWHFGSQQSIAGDVIWTFCCHAYFVQYGISPESVFNNQKGAPRRFFVKQIAKTVCCLFLSLFK